MGKFSSLLLGAITGAAAAYFLTSKKGKETTDKVRDFVKEYQENPDDIHEAVVQSAKDFSNQAVSAIQQTKEKLRKARLQLKQSSNLSKKRPSQSWTIRKIGLTKSKKNLIKKKATC